MEIITAGPPTSYLNNHQGITEGSSGGNFVVGQSFSFGVGSKEIEDELEAPTSAAGIYIYCHEILEKKELFYLKFREIAQNSLLASQTKILLLLYII